MPILISIIKRSLRVRKKGVKAEVISAPHMVHNLAKVWSFARDLVQAAKRIAEVDLLDESGGRVP
jgi:hypothetical protein